MNHKIEKFIVYTVAYLLLVFIGLMFVALLGLVSPDEISAIFE